MTHPDKTVKAEDSVNLKKFVRYRHIYKGRFGAFVKSDLLIPGCKVKQKKNSIRVGEFVCEYPAV